MARWVGVGRPGASAPGPAGQQGGAPPPPRSKNPRVLTPGRRHPGVAERRGPEDPRRSLGFRRGGVVNAQASGGDSADSPTAALAAAATEPDYENAQRAAETGP